MEAASGQRVARAAGRGLAVRRSIGALRTQALLIMVADGIECTDCVTSNVRREEGSICHQLGAHKCSTAS